MARINGINSSSLARTNMYIQQFDRYIFFFVAVFGHPLAIEVERESIQKRFGSSMNLNAHENCFSTSLKGSHTNENKTVFPSHQLEEREKAKYLNYKSLPEC